MTKPAARVGRIVLALALAFAVASGRVDARRGAAPLLRELRGIADLQSQFDSDRGRIRIVLLLSPT